MRKTAKSSGEPPTDIHRSRSKAWLGRSVGEKVGLVLLSKDAPGQGSSTADIDFLKDRFEMILHGVRRDVQGGSYLRGRTALQNQVGHLPFPLGEMIRLHEEWRNFHRVGDLEHHSYLSWFSPTGEP